MIKPLASAFGVFVAVASPVSACDHLQSLGQTCSACAAPASATSSTVYTQTVTQALAPVIRYEIRPAFADVVIPDPLPEVPEVPTPIQPLPAPSCNAGGAAGVSSYSHSYSTHSYSSGNGFSGVNSAYGANGVNGVYFSHARAVQRQAIRNHAVHANAAIRANRAVQYGYDAQAQQAIGGNGKVKALPRLRNAIGSLFGKP